MENQPPTPNISSQQRAPRKLPSSLTGTAPRKPARKLPRFREDTETLPVLALQQPGEVEKFLRFESEADKARWEAAMGDTLKAWVTMHEVYSIVYVS